MAFGLDKFKSTVENIESKAEPIDKSGSLPKTPAQQQPQTTSVFGIETPLNTQSTTTQTQTKTEQPTLGTTSVFGIQTPKVESQPVEAPKVEAPKVEPTPSEPVKLETPQLTPEPEDPEFGLVTQTADEQTKAIEEIASNPIDPTGKTSADIEDEIYARNKEMFLRDKLRTDQMNQERYSQQLAQQGFAGSGAQQALMLMLQASNANGTATGLQQLQLANLERMAADKRQEEAQMQNLFTQMVEQGDLSSALALAGSMSALDPDNTYWSHLANNPEQFQRAFDPLVQARIAQRRDQANGVISRIDFSNPAQVASSYNEWKKFFYDTPDDLSAEREAGWSAISQEDKQRIFQETFGSELPRNISEAEADEIYAKYMYEKKIANLEENFVAEQMRDNLIKNGATDEDLETFQEGLDLFMNSPASAEKFVLNGISFEDGDEFSERGKYLFEDWYGGDYDLDGNKRSERDQYNIDMDQMWGEYVKGLESGATPVSRNAFMEAVKQADYLEGEPLSSKQIQDAISAYEQQTGMSEIRNTLNNYGVVSGKDFQNLSAADVKDILSTTDITPDQLAKELFAVTDLSKRLYNREGSSDGTQKISSYNDVLGLDAIRSGSYPSYIVRDGEMYMVGEPRLKGNHWLYTMKPMSENGVEFDTLVQIEGEAGYGYKVDPETGRAVRYSTRSR